MANTNISFRKHWTGCDLSSSQGKFQGPPIVGTPFPYYILPYHSLKNPFIETGLVKEASGKSYYLGSAEKILYSRSGPLPNELVGRYPALIRTTLLRFAAGGWKQKQKISHKWSFNGDFPWIEIRKRITN